MPLRALLADKDSFGCHAVPRSLVDADADVELWLASAIAHPEWLDAGYLGGEDDREADERELEIDAPTRPPALVLFVDPARGFVEQVPQHHASEPAKPE